MAVVEELLRTEENGAISFGNYKLDAKAKVEDYEHGGDLYKVKTYRKLTKLEKNGMFAYESEPGTSVLQFVETENGVSFLVESDADAQITVGLEEDTEYSVSIGESRIGAMKTNLSGKLSISVELENTGEVAVKMEKIKNG